MNLNPHRCVIDKEGFFVTNVVMVDEFGRCLDTPYAHVMEEGEILIEATRPIGFVKPRWNGLEWEETATAEEIETAKIQQEQLLE